MTADCHQFEEAILDLAYGELSDTEAESLRMHAASCAKCRAALEDILLTRKLAAQLPSLSPGAELDAAVLDTARDLSRSEAAPSGRELLDSNIADISKQTRPTLVERLREMLLTPALATAAVAALVLVVSLFLMNQGGKEHNSFQGEMESPVHSTLPEPAQPKAEKGAAFPVAEAPNPEFAAAPQEQNQKMASRSEGISADIDPRASRRSSSKARRRSKPAVGNLGTAGNGLARRSPAKPSKSSPAPKAKKSVTAEHLFSMDAPDDFAASPARDRAEAREQLAGAFSESELGPNSTGDFNRGMEAYRRGDCSAASSAFRKVLQQSSNPGQITGALHHLARCEKRRGRCGQAVPVYERLLKQYPTYKNRPEALWEASQCRRRLGHIEKARALLSALIQIPGWEARAQKGLNRLDGATKAKSNQ